MATSGYILWGEGIATTFLRKEVLEERGFDVTTAQYAAGPLYTGLATGQIDFQTDSWLPVTHAEYGEKYGDQLEDLGKWYGPTSLELSVPGLEAGIQRAGKGSEQDAVRTWLKANPELAEKWAPTGGSEGKSGVKGVSNN